METIDEGSFTKAALNLAIKIGLLGTISGGSKSQTDKYLMQYLYLGSAAILARSCSKRFYFLDCKNSTCCEKLYNVQNVFLTDKCEEIYDTVYECKTETFNIYLWPQLLKLLRYKSVVLSFIFGWLPTIYHVCCFIDIHDRLEPLIASC